MITKDREEEMAQAWLSSHPDVGGSLPSDVRRADNGETISKEVAFGAWPGADGVGEEGRRHRPLESYSAWPTIDEWEQAFRLAGVTYAPLVHQQRALTTRQWKERVRVDVAFQSMRPQQAELLRLRYFERLTLEEIAQEMRVSYQAVQQRLATAHRNFRRAYGEYERGTP